METLEFDIEFLSQRLSENPASPLFARLADLYLQNEQTVEALKLCEEGIAAYPDYYAGYIVLGKIHLALKEYSKAHDTLAKARLLSPFNHTVDWLIKSIPQQQDESIRTTDENYFSAQEETAVIDSDQSADTAVIPEVSAEQAQFEMPTAEELGFSHQVDDSISGLPQGGQQESSSGQPFPSYDEYYAQHQSRTAAAPTQSLDEFLNTSNDAAGQEPIQNAESDVPADVIGGQESPRQTEEPEIVFSSPEQEQLFAEMSGGIQPEETSGNTGTDIGDLAERLQNVERIVPQSDVQSVQPPADDDQSHSYGSDMVTPTLAEIYASQGEFTAAIQAYEILMFSQPGKTAEFQQRVRELQQLQMERDGLV